MSGLSMDPLDDVGIIGSTAKGQAEREADWIRQMRSLAEAVQDDPALVAELERHVSRVEQELERRKKVAADAEAALAKLAKRHMPALASRVPPR